MVNLIRCCCQTRPLFVAVCCSASMRPQCGHGVPQGARLGSLLFSIYTSENARMSHLKLNIYVVSKYFYSFFFVFFLVFHL